MLHKALHDSKFFVAEMDRFFAAAQLCAFKIEGEVAVGDLVEHNFADTSREGADTGKELVVIKWLGHVIVGAAVKAGDLV